ncbi:aminotransferase class V-fold PLP-dependent enzyme, partial [Burkholderia pseudomallei]
NLVANGLSVAAHTQAVLQEGDELIVSALEPHANLVPWQRAARRCGAKLRLLHPVPQGSVHGLDLERVLGPRPRVFAV